MRIPAGTPGVYRRRTFAAEQFERRVAALEAHITDLEGRLNERGIFSGPTVRQLAHAVARQLEENERSHAGDADH